MQSKEASNGLLIPSHLYLLEHPCFSAFRARFWFATGDLGSLGYVFRCRKQHISYHHFFFFCAILSILDNRKHRKGVFFFPGASLLSLKHGVCFIVQAA
jgi:hypothetical protein